MEEGKIKSTLTRVFSTQTAKVCLAVFAALVLFAAGFASGSSFNFNRDCRSAYHFDRQTDRPGEFSMRNSRNRDFPKENCGCQDGDYNNQDSYRLRRIQDGSNNSFQVEKTPSETNAPVIDKAPVNTEVKLNIESTDKTQPLPNTGEAPKPLMETQQ
jgi:hypothetical protein